MIRFLIAALYLAIGCSVSAIAICIYDKPIHKENKPIIFTVLAIEWPLILGIILLLTAGKILQEIIHKPLVCLIWLVLMIILLIEVVPANAAVITGDKPLAGASWVYAHKTERFYDPDDLELLAQVLEHENYSTGERAMYLTGAVVLNRVKSPKWPNTVHDVVYQKGQYSTTGKFWSRPVHDDCYRIASWLLIFGSPDVPKNLMYQAMFPQGSGVYEFIKTDYFCYE